MKQAPTSRLAAQAELFSETKQLEREVNALYSLLTGMLGAEKLVLKAGKLEALSLLQSQNLQERVLGLQIVISNNPSLKKVPALEEIPELLLKLYDQLAEQIALRTVEETIEQKVAAKMQEKYDEYLLELKKQLLKEEKGPENPQTLKKYAQLEKLRKKKLNRFVLELLRPQKLEEIVGQQKAIAALVAKLASPYPQHIIIYGPPGVGKTTAARLALEAAKKIKESPFSEDAPFIEVDGATLRWDPRDIANPLLGSVHDPIYQGARRDLIDGGVPEPKPGLVTDAHGGILFIDEIGEMDPQLQSKLLKVLEDKKVYFESAYYDPTDPQVTKYIHQLFTEGAPADFVLIGATTRPPHAINPALRSRCSAVFFEPLTPQHVEAIVEAAAAKLKMELAEGAAALIADYTTEGRQAVNLLADAYGLALFRRRHEQEPVVITKDLVQETLRAGRYTAHTVKKNTEGEAVGKVYGLGVSGFLGSVLEIEAVAFAAAEAGRGTIRFNETAGSMARDSVFNAAAVIRSLTGEKLHNYDLHINVIGGGRIDGPSAGLAMVVVLLSAIKEWPVSQRVAVTGEVSIRGQIRPVGGIAEKLFGARLAGIQTVLVPYENKDEVPVLPGMQVIPVKTVGEALPWLFGERAREVSME